MSIELTQEDLQPFIGGQLQNQIIDESDNLVLLLQGEISEIKVEPSKITVFFAWIAEYQLDLEKWMALSLKEFHPEGYVIKSDSFQISQLSAEWKIALKEVPHATRMVIFYAAGRDEILSKKQVQDV